MSSTEPVAADSSEPVSASEKKMIVLKSSDGETFEIEEVVANESLTLRHMIEDDCADNTIPVPNVTSPILAKVIEYCRKHVEASAEAAAESGDGDVVDEDLKKFDAEFVKEDVGTIIDIILAANYLNIKKLIDFTCETMANIIKDKSVEDVREIFNIENDYTPEEEEELRRENSWAFE